MGMIFMSRESFMLVRTRIFTVLPNLTARTGILSTVRGVAATNIARWDGTSWSALGSPNNTLQRVFSDGLYLYAGGNFTQISGVTAARVARWDGTSWSALGAGMNGTVYDFGRNEAAEVL